MQVRVTNYTAEEMADLGRAMERVGIADISTFLCWAGKQKTAEILSEKTEK